MLPELFGAERGRRRRVWPAKLASGGIKEYFVGGAGWPASRGQSNYEASLRGRAFLSGAFFARFLRGRRRQPTWCRVDRSIFLEHQAASALGRLLNF